MIELARYEARRRLRGSVILSVAVAAFAALVIWIYPSYSEAIDDAFLEELPTGMIRVFDIRTIATIEGFLAFELYIFGWIILLGLYLAYLGAGTVADDLERGRLEIWLSLPVSRSRTVLEKFLALSVPIFAVNVVTAVVVIVGSHLIDDPVAVADVVAVHAVSILYLYACAAIGLFASVLADRVTIAQRLALGVTFGLFLIESLLVDTDYEDVGLVAPSRHFDPNEILLDGTVDAVSVAVLIAMTGLLVAASVWWFRRRDV